MEQQAFNLLLTYFAEEHGLSKNQAANIALGIMANIKSVSNFNPAAESGNGRGILNWSASASRLRGLDMLCGKESADIECQLNWMIAELEEGREMGVPNEGNYDGVRRKIVGKPDARYVAEIFYNEYMGNDDRSDREARAFTVGQEAAKYLAKKDEFLKNYMAVGYS